MPGKRILIVEDDPSMRKVLSARLKSEGYDAVAVADAISAFADLRKQTPALVLLDLGLPGGGGLNLMQRMQSMPALAVVPIIVLSARERSSGIEAEVLDKGASAFFQKPTPQEMLLEKIRELIGFSDRTA